MVSIHPVESKSIRVEVDSEPNSSAFKSQLVSLTSMPNGSDSASRLFQQKITKTTSEGERKVVYKSADDVLSKKGKSKCPAKRSLTINYVREEAEHVFDAFCSRNSKKSSSAPTSFSARVDRNISENKMKKLKSIVTNNRESDMEMEGYSEGKERKKKSFFKRIKERIKALNNKEPLHIRSERERQREKKKKEREEEKQKFTQKIFESFRARRKSKNRKVGHKKDENMSLSGSSLISDQKRSYNKRHLWDKSHDTSIQTTPPEAPQSPSPPVLEDIASFIPKAISATAEESRVRESPLEPPPSTVRGSPYLAFFDSSNTAGSSVDKSRGLSRLMGLAEIRYIDEDDGDLFGSSGAGENSGGVVGDRSQRGTEGGGVVERGVTEGMDVGSGISQSSVDHRHRLSSISDSGCEDVIDKYTQVADLLDMISEEVNNEIEDSINKSRFSSSKVVMALVYEKSYEHFKQQLNLLLQQLNEPLLKQVALVFSITRSAINMTSSQNGLRIKSFLLQYYNSHFAVQVASEGGLESLTEDSDT